jgi:hypothetical protein
VCSTTRPNSGREDTRGRVQAGEAQIVQCAGADLHSEWQPRPDHSAALERVDAESDEARDGQSREQQIGGRIERLLAGDRYHGR